MNEKTTFQQLDNEVDLLEKKVNNIISSYEYYGNLIEDLRNLFVEYEIDDSKIVCFSSCDITNETGIETNVENIELSYYIKILSDVNIFKFNAVDFNDKNTKFNVTIFKEEKEIDKYVLDTLEDVKNNIIKWLICCI